MPSPPAYLRGYKLKKGMTMAGYEQTHISVGHNQVVRYREYTYPTKMIWSKKEETTPEDLLHSLEMHTSQDRVIMSQYGNPYSCTFGVLDANEEEDGTVIITSLGRCHRIFKTESKTIK